MMSLKEISLCSNLYTCFWLLISSIQHLLYPRQPQADPGNEIPLDFIGPPADFDPRGKLVGFKSSTGGLVAPKYDNTPWNYKFTWNPRNVVLAGQGGA